MFQHGVFLRSLLCKHLRNKSEFELNRIQGPQGQKAINFLFKFSARNATRPQAFLLVGLKS